MAVTGAATGLGRALVERLARRQDLAGLIGIDLEPGPVDGVMWRASDVRDPLLAQRLVGVDTVVHLAAASGAADPDARRALNVRGTAVVLDAARTAGVARVVLVTSASVYGHRADNPVPLPADAALRALPGDDLVGDHVEIERLAAAARLPVAILRPAALVGGGLGREYDSPLLRQLSAPRLLAARGTEPLRQLCHSDDLLSALELVVMAGLTGALPVASDGALRQSVVEELAGRRRVELPASAALSTAERLHRLGVSTASPRELDHLVGHVVVGSDRLRAAGWAPAWTNDAALRAHLLSRAKGGGHAGAYTAAGATVAALGTAALVRQARRRRRGL
ncbi:MAG: NAD-dependent epimerase/dehydratase family protein [Mycobacteriales bacterium]